MRVAAEVVLTAREREELAVLANSAATSPRLALRVRIVLLAAQGMQNKDIADELGMGRAQVARWRERYVQWRLPGIENSLPRGAPPVKVDLARLAELTSKGRPDSPEPWSTRALAQALGVSAATVSRHWKAGESEASVNRGTPAQAVVPDFAGQIVDIVGLYADGGEHALVLAGSIEGKPSRASEGARRAGVTALFGALRELDGHHADVNRGGTRRARDIGWLAFLRKLERDVPEGAALHVLCDNYTTHHHPTVRRWLARHPRIHAYFCGNAASWLRMVQRCFRAMDAGTLQHTMRAAPSILASIEAYRQRSSADTPYLWLASSANARLDRDGTAPVTDNAEAAERTTSVQDHAPTRHHAPREIVADPVADPNVADRLMPPRLTYPLFPREALMARLQDARRQRCLVVRGHAGSGKTSTLLAWRRLLLSLDYDVTWLTLSADDNSPARFFACLLASIAQASPAAARDTALLVKQQPAQQTPQAADATMEHWVIRLVQRLTSHPRDLVLMLDDLDRINDIRIFRVLQWLLDYAPPNIHLVLGSRTAVPLSLVRARARGVLTEIGVDDLRFTAEEMERFLAVQLGSIDARAAESARLADGWPMGLQLIASALRGRRHPDWRTEHARVVGAAASYFESEVLGDLAAEDLELLVATAICQRTCGPLSAAMLGRAGDAARMSAALARLEAGNLFVARAGDSGGDVWYCQHPLLRDVLLARVDQMPEADRLALHAAAAAWFGANGMTDEAVHHAVQAGEVEAAARMVEGCAYDLLARGELSRLAGLLRRLPATELRERFDLLLVSAYFGMYTSQFDAAHECLARIAARRRSLDSRQRYAEALIRAGLALQQDDPDTALAMVPTLRDDIPAEADDFSWNCRSNILGWAYVYQGRYDQARAVVQEAGTRGAGTRSRLLGDCVAAMSLAAEGRLADAELTVRDALEKADARGAGAIGLSCMTAGLLAGILYEVNDTEAAVRLLEPRLNVLERASLPDTVMHACRVLSHAHWLAGRRTQAMACIDRLEAYADRFQLDRLHAEAHALRLRWHHELGEMQGTNTALRQLEAIGKRHASGNTETARRVLAVVRQANDEVLLQMRDFAAGAARIAQQLENDALHPVRAAQLELQLALAQRHLGRPQAAHAHLCRALALGHQLGLVRTLLDVAPDLFTQIHAILEAGPLDPVLDFYVTRLKAEASAAQAIAGGHAAAPADTDTADMLSEREREVLDLAAQAMPNKKIAVVLGLAPETVKWHLKNIYAKLGVSGRGGAAARLRDLAGAYRARERR
jgi:LuxR family maltose regulon positive regulatory protein